MLVNKQTRLLKLFVSSIISLGLLSPTLAIAAEAPPSAAQMLINFSQTIPSLMSLVTAVAYVMGMGLVYKGVMALKQYGDQRTQMSSAHSLKGPLLSLFIGAALLYLPSSVLTGFNTFWSDPNPYGYITKATDQYSIIIRDSYMIVQLIGTIAFIRGLLTLNQMGGHGGQPNTFSKGLTYIIAGILCINLFDFLGAVRGTLGL
jgi:hypothetical protein